MFGNLSRCVLKSDDEEMRRSAEMIKVFVITSAARDSYIALCVSVRSSHAISYFL